jgi:hypothetical protein
MIATQTPPQAGREDVARILADVRAHASRRKRPALAVLVGLPASGKSRVAEELRARTGAVVLESDALRRLLFPRRTYSAEESRRLFAAVHRAIEELLAEGVSVIVDATNLAEAERAPLYEIAERRGARLVLAQVSAPGALVRRRLARRETTGVSRSEADLRVYQRMRSRVEEIQRPHHVVDTSQEIEPALAAIAKEMTGS